MKIKKIINITMIVLCFCLVAGIGAFIFNSIKGYKINNDFVSLPLQFNPDDSSSSYKMNNSQITVYGGFVKGIQKGKDGTQNLIIRALSPLPIITVKGVAGETVSLILENINPDFYAKSIENSNLQISKITVNKLQFNIVVNAGETKKIEPVKPSSIDNTEKYKYVILGDN